MKNENYRKELEVAQRLAVQAGNAILPIYYGAMEVTTKADNTPVTNADVLANRLIQEGIQTAFPLDGIVSEELGIVQGKERCWYIDPIDGTRGFIEHTDQFAVHIGLAVEERAVLGIVYKPVAKEMYYAVRGVGTFRSSPYNDPQQIYVRKHETITAAMDKDNALSEEYRRFAKELGISRSIISGSEGLRVVKVAEGVADVHFNMKPSNFGTWDVCAPFMIAEEAGAYIQYTDAGPIRYMGQRRIEKTFVVANSRDLADRVSELIERS